MGLFSILQTGGENPVPAILFQRLHGAHLLAFVAQNALRGVYAITRVFVHLHVHRANFQTFTALDTLLLIAADTKPGIVAHRLEEDRNRADILAKRTVIFERDGQQDADHVIEQIADEENHEHRLLGGFPEMEQQENENERQRENDVTDVADLLPRTLRLLVGQ